MTESTSPDSSPETTADAETGRVLIDQIEGHLRDIVRPRLEGLTDEEYRFDPTGDGDVWTVHPRTEGELPEGRIEGGAGDSVVDFAFPEPSPAPFTTIAWRLAHVIVGVLAMRSHNHHGGPEADYMTWHYATTADEALAQLDEELSRWIEGVKEWSPAHLAEPCGATEGPYGHLSRADLVAHINRELIHHLAEVCLLRDLYAHRR